MAFSVVSRSPRGRRFLNRGQGWIVKRLNGSLLEEMKTRHRGNIEACEQVAE
jgi:hypothetical protein